MNFIWNNGAYEFFYFEALRSEQTTFDNLCAESQIYTWGACQSQSFFFFSQNPVPTETPALGYNNLTLPYSLKGSSPTTYQLSFWMRAVEVI